jgi:hypothetical protein
MAQDAYNLFMLVRLLRYYAFEKLRSLFLQNRCKISYPNWRCKKDTNASNLDMYNDGIWKKKPLCYVKYLLFLLFHTEMKWLRDQTMIGQRKIGEGIIRQREAWTNMFPESNLVKSEFPQLCPVNWHVFKSRHLFIITCLTVLESLSCLFWGPSPWWLTK